MSALSSVFPFFPQQASTIAPSVDALFTFLIALTAFLSIGIFATILFFAVKYRRNAPGRRPVPDTATHRSRLGLELFWTVVPIGVNLIIFTWGASLYMRNARAPDAAQDIYVVGRQWMWKVQHTEGRREINELHVPVGEPIKLTMASQDVIHSFYIPAFRMKQDVVPGRYTTMWFQATQAGEFHLFCAEYCGTQHSGMIGRVVVMEPADYERWLGGVNEESPVKSGERLFTDLNCVNCHATAERQRCPQLGGLYGTDVDLANGNKVHFDEAYIRESVVDPNAKIAAGYPPVMPTYRGQVTEEQIIQLIAYIKSLSPSAK